MLNFTFEALEQAQSSLDRINNFLYELSNTSLEDGETPEASALAENMEQDFIKGLSDDLNISAALAALFEMIRKENVLLSEGKILKKDAEKLVSVIKSIDQVLAVVSFPEKKEETISNEDLEKINLREKARAEKNFNLADQIRDELLQKGIVLEDSKDGVRWKIIKK
jgi:cysteinyl-tRNA synthetase